MTSPQARAPLGTVDELIALLAELGRQDDPRSTDVVPALAHLLQTAECLAAAVPDDPELVAAGLVHDLASAIDPDCVDHGPAGADLVRPLLGARVASLVAGHTDAKRFLVTVEPGYGHALSATSTFTLIGQGGPMDPRERERFVRRADFDALIRLRRADDGAKVPDGMVRPIEAWRSLLEQVAVAR